MAWTSGKGTCLCTYITDEGNFKVIAEFKGNGCESVRFFYRKNQKTLLYNPKIEYTEIMYMVTINLKERANEKM